MKGREMEYQLPTSFEDSFSIIQSRLSETAREAFETLVWSESIPEDAVLDDSIASAVMLAVADFLNNPTVTSIIDQHAMTPEFLGQNLVLSGNRHGTGFWDRRSAEQDGVTDEQLQALHNYSIQIDVYDDEEGTWYAV